MNVLHHFELFLALSFGPDHWFLAIFGSMNNHTKNLDFSEN